MRSGLKYSISIMFLIAISAIGQPRACAQSGNSPPPAPTDDNSAASTPLLVISDQIHWQAVLKVAAKPNAMITIDDIKDSFQERTFKKVALGHYEIPGVLQYSVSDPERLREQFPDRKQIHIEVYFRDRDPRTCLAKERLAHDLTGAGWNKLFARPELTQPGLDGGPPTHHLPEEIFVKEDQGVFSITYENDCPQNVAIDANKIYFDLLVRKPAMENGQ
ncbi:hypothetical protein [Dyella sp. ASV21]|uniref:hypothetical protein n=1 Tax=Dyella sp. ASV21 TaxID=2795114 RepID=UPI0018ED8444|nr:hypothetical protein [Dyella sp. ASV21]